MQSASCRHAPFAFTHATFIRRRPEQASFRWEALKVAFRASAARGKSPTIFQTEEGKNFLQRSLPSLAPHMGVLVARQGEIMALQEDVMVGSEQERLLLLTSMLGVAEHDLVSTQDRLNAMHQLQLEKDQELMKKEREMGSLHDVSVLPRTDAARPSHAYGTTKPTAHRVLVRTSGPWKGLSHRACLTLLHPTLLRAHVAPAGE